MHRRSGGGAGGARVRRRLAVAVGAWVAAFAGIAPAEEAPTAAALASEPPQLFLLELEGAVHPLQLDRPLVLPALPDGGTATLRVRPYREFARAGVSFRYPRHMAFEADFDSPGLRLWTLSGNDSVLMVAQYPTRGQHRMQETLYAQELMTRYAGHPMRAEPAELALPEGRLRGRRIQVTLVETTIQQEIFAFTGREGDVLIGFQDNPAADGTPSAEARELLEMFRASFAR